MGINKTKLRKYTYIARVIYMGKVIDLQFISSNSPMAIRRRATDTIKETSLPHDIDIRIRKLGSCGVCHEKINGKWIKNVCQLAEAIGLDPIKYWFDSIY